MRRFISILFILLSTFSNASFFPNPRISTNIGILNRKAQPVSRITDGDTIQIQIKFSQSVTQQEKINFQFGESSFAVGSCVITSGNTSCVTDPFPSLGWHWDSNGIAQNTRIVQAKNDSAESLG